MWYLSIIKSIFLPILILGCVPGTTGEADFYELCAQHNRRFSGGDAIILRFDEAKGRSDYHFWEDAGRATVTVIIRALSRNATGEATNAAYIQRRCEFRKTGRGWRLI
jgi:hypothetical protein